MRPRRRGSHYTHAREEDLSGRPLMLVVAPAPRCTVAQNESFVTPFVPEEATTKQQPDRLACTESPKPLIPHNILAPPGGLACELRSLSAS